MKQSRKNLISQLILTYLFLVLCSESKADEIRLGRPGYGGNGCPAGTVSVTLSPDAQDMALLFDQFSAQAGGEEGKTFDRKSCNIAIPVSIPQGYSVSIFSTSYRGFAAIPLGGSGQFNAEYFFAGERGPKITKKFHQETFKEYFLNHDLELESLVWSKCGDDVILRVNTSAMVQTNDLGSEVQVMVDSADLEAGIIYHLMWKRCR